MLDRKAIVSRFLGDMSPPPFATPAAVIAKALPALQPSRRIDVPTWAEANRILRSAGYSGPWRNDFAAYMVEPARMLTSRRFSGLIFCGPARTVKTEHLVINTVGHRAECMPRNMLVLSPTKDTAREFSIEKIDPFIRHTPSVRERLGTGRSDDNIYDKRFAGGMRLRLGWPVIGQLSMFDIPDVLLTDYDRMVEDVDGEGSPFALALKRTQTFGSLGMAVAEGSPGRPVLDPEWKPSTPHEAPPTTGILQLFNRGTRARFYWTCPGCGELFQPEMAALKYEVRDSAGQSAKTVEMVCPSGCLIRHDQKHELNRTGTWLHETDDGRLVTVDDPDIRSTDIVSYWLEGPVAAMQAWDQIILRYLQASEDFKATGDETALKTTINVDQGRPYVPQQLEVGEGLSEDALKATAGRYPLGIAPDWTRFITVQVDVQARGYVVHADAWGPGLERRLIDRQEILMAPDSAPGAPRPIDPARYIEDWQALLPLLDHAYPVEGGELSMKPKAMIVDSGGAKGVTNNAYAFWRKNRRRDGDLRIYLAKGQGGLNRDRARYGTPEKVLGNKQAKRSDIRLIYVGTDKLKDELVGSLTRKDPGPNAYHLSELLPDRVFSELCAELRTPTGWERKKSAQPNEAFDLAVYGRALAIVLKAEKINWEKPPAWADVPARNSNSVRRVSAADKAPAEKSAEIEKKKSARPSKRRSRQGGFVMRGIK